MWANSVDFRLKDRVVSVYCEDTKKEVTFQITRSIFKPSVTTITATVRLNQPR